MAKAIPLRFRQIHLDFHTGPWIGDVGRDFDARAFARTMKAAHVNSVTVFAKCHHGHLYYNTRRPERHPGLPKGLDLLRGQVDALHRQGIRAPIYISVQIDGYAAHTHPEWLARQPDGKPFGPGPFDPGWPVLDMSSPYQEYLAEQTREVLKLFAPVDGIFFDMCWNQYSCSKWTIQAIKDLGWDPALDTDRYRYSNLLALRYMKRFHKMVKDANPNATVYFNSRPLSNLAQELPYLAQVEIEALPTAGFGYLYFPKNARFARTFDREYMGMTARFHKAWGDFGAFKPYPALEYETSQMMAHGAKCSVGDQLHPRGVLDKAAYELIGKVYARVEEREPWLSGAKPVAQMGLLQVPSHQFMVAGGTDEGAARMLQQLKQQFDVVFPGSDLDRYELLILPDAIQVDKPLAARLRPYLRRGGAILASHLSGLDDQGKQVLLPELGIKAAGFLPYQTTYIRFGNQIGQDVPAADHVMYERGVCVTAAAGATAVARVVDPYFDRAWNHFSSHSQTPDAKLSRYAAAVRKGSVAYIAYPIFRAFAKHGNYPYRLLVRNLLAQLLPDPILRIDAPTSTETSVMRQGKRTIVHLLQYCPERRAENLDVVEDIVPLYDVPMSLKLDKAPARVYLAPERTPVEFAYQDGRVELLVPEVAGHAMVVFE